MSKRNLLLISLISFVMILTGFSYLADASNVDRIVWRFSSDPRTLDPHLNNQTAGSKIIDRMFEGLLREEYDWAIVPAIAENWEVNEEGTVYTFYLRKDAKWSDGVSITVADFEFAWKRVLRPETGAPKAAQLFSIKNAEQYYLGEIDFDEVGIEFVDAHTIIVELAYPLAWDEALAMFADHVYYPLREDIVTANPDNWATSPDKMVTNGPYKMVSYGMNEEITLVKDQNYWDRENRGLLDEIKFVFIGDSLTALRAFEVGEIDGFDGVPDEEIPRLLMESDELVLMPRISLSYFVMNMEKPPLDNKLVREALVLAIDKEQLVSASVSGMARPATGIVPHGTSSLGMDFRAEADKEGIRLPINGDIERAQQALAEAGYPNGEGFPAISYLYNASPGNTQTAEMLQEMWKKNLNIDIALENVEYTVESQRRHSGDFQLARASWVGTRFPAYYLNIHRSGDHNNMSQYSNADYDALVDEYRAETDSVRKHELLNEAEKWIINEYVIAPLTFGSASYVLDSKFQGIQMTPRGYPVFEYIYIQK